LRLFEPNDELRTALATRVIWAAPLAGYIPLAALGAVLAVVAWNMAEREDFMVLLGTSSGDRLVLLTTFLLTVFVDLTTGIGVGVVLGAFIFLHRMAEAIEIDGQSQLIAEDQADDYAGRTSYNPAAASDLVVYRISGAFFFGAMAAVSGVLDRIGKLPPFWCSIFPRFRSSIAPRRSSCRNSRKS
jgi:sulfate permease, SulP family